MIKPNLLVGRSYSEAVAATSSDDVLTSWKKRSSLPLVIKNKAPA